MWRSADVAAERFGAVAEGGTVVSPADFYAALRRTGVHHGQAFAALTGSFAMPGGSSETEIVLPDEAVPHRGYRIHPVMLDAALQGLAAAMPAESLADSTEATYLPVSLETIRVFGDVGRRARCRAELVSLDDDGAGMLGRVILMDDAGTPTAEVTGVYLRRVQRPHGAITAGAEDLRHRLGAGFDAEIGPETSAAPLRKLVGVDRRRRNRRRSHSDFVSRIRLTDPASDQRRAVG